MYCRALVARSVEKAATEQVDNSHKNLPFPLKAQPNSEAANDSLFGAMES
jgi:hypothetical protein